jgi:RNA polymerase sigma-70 factor (ECF subfamily)
MDGFRPVPGSGLPPVDGRQLSELIAATATGDRRAFSELYRQTGAHLYALLLRMLQNRELADEALQDCYLRIWQKAETYACDKGAPLTWLLTVARYRALDLLRMQRPEVPLPEDDQGWEAPALIEPGANPEMLALETQGLDRLKACLDELSEEQRRSVLLAYYEGYTHPELAQRLNAPLGTVKSWVRRGLAHLRECLDR